MNDATLWTPATVVRRGQAVGCGAFPTTRYQGSKRKLAGRILRELCTLEWNSVLDAFGGSGAVAYGCKQAGKQVTYNDILSFNHQIGLALIENDGVVLAEDVVAWLTTRHANIEYDDFIERTFDGVFFLPEENRWLDTVCQNIDRLSCPYQRAIAWFAAFQSALIKRPYNLFHRSNLSMRVADVPRSFGNKATWDRAFDVYFSRFAREANQAILDGGGRCRSICGNALDVPGDFDLVYIDTPYIKRNKVGVDYLDFYHFLEGMVNYPRWPERVDHRFMHRPIRQGRTDRWIDPAKCLHAFGELFDRFRESILAVSYRSDGIPSIQDLADLMKRIKSKVCVRKLAPYQYALSKSQASEVLIIGN